MPIVADVDNDGNAEIVFVENDAGNPSGGATQGHPRLRRRLSDSWVPTRRIWNQHSYHVTNVDRARRHPPRREAHRTGSSRRPRRVAGVMNNFRQNLPEFDVFAAPDLTVSLALDQRTTCPAYARASWRTVCNEGALVVGAGVPVSVLGHRDDGGQVACANAPVVTTLAARARAVPER
jgi:hypothetical protein